MPPAIERTDLSFKGSDSVQLNFYAICKSMISNLQNAPSHSCLGFSKGINDWNFTRFLE